MAMDADHIKQLIESNIEDAQATITDLRGDGDHYAAHIVSPVFKGLPRVKQHKLVYNALEGKMGNELHALAIQTSAPEE